MKQYSLDHHGHHLIVEFDNSPMFWHRVRLIVDDQVVDERSLFYGTTRLRAHVPVPVAVDAVCGGFGPKGARLAARPGVAEAVPFREG